MQRVIEGRDLTADQSAWMDRIKLHLVQNLSVDRDDFALVPVLSDQGGWGSANKTFGGELDELLADINRELATV
jgi:type I restriction enzyme R subunit